MIDRNQAGRDKSPTWPAWAGQRSPFPELLSDGAAEYYEQRDNQGDNAALLVAIASYGELLEEQRRERIPLQWATTQNKLGYALATLGERESGTARLEGAVTAYREALKERTRERAPLQWATTQNNLGLALLRLGERESGTARLEEAVSACREQSCSARCRQWSLSECRSSFRFIQR
jgi:tetratricopeptide (TPR) repeat protein